VAQRLWRPLWEVSAAPPDDSPGMGCHGISWDKQTGFHNGINTVIHQRFLADFMGFNGI